MIGAVIFGALRDLVNDHCYASRFPQPSVDGPGTETARATAPSWPAIRYTLSGALNEGTVTGTTGMADDDSDVLIDVVAKTKGAMELLCEEVDARMRSLADPPLTRENYFHTWDAETRTHRGILTYRLYASAGIGSP